MSSIFLPVSIGEAIDKLTILDIKLDKITDQRRNDVQKEYDSIKEKSSDFIENYQELYKSMKKVNLIIWEQMDLLRDGNINDDNYAKLCRECIETNDIRFRIKNKINMASNSNIKEQKSYKINRLILDIKKIDDIIFLINPIKYFSIIYDELFLNFDKDINKEILETMFKYDKNIKFNQNEKEYKKKIVLDKYFDKNQIYKILGIDEKYMLKII